MRHRRRLWLTTAVLALGLCAWSPSGASALQATKIIANDSRFRGDDCGERFAVGWKLARRAHSVRLFGPGKGKILRDQRTGRPVGKILGRYKRRLRGGRLFAGFSFKSSRSACRRPDLYPGGWYTRNFGMRVRFKSFERVSVAFSLSPPRHSPRTFFFGANEAVYGINWRGWDGHRAFGRGTWYYNDCDPYCAAGNYTAYPATVEVYRARNCGGRWFYLRAIVTQRGPYGRNKLRANCGSINGTSVDRGAEVQFRNPSRRRLSG